MTLQTTRIDTLYPPVLHGDNPVSHQNAHRRPEEMLLVDFVPNGPKSNSSAITNASISTTNMIPTRFNSYPIQAQQLPNHVNHNHSIHNNNVNHNNNNDLSNYTLVNLSNQQEPDDEEEESQVFFKDHIPIKRTYVPGGAIIATSGQNVKVSSSMSSSSSTEGDSDTGFLVPQNGIKGKSLGKDKHYKLQSSAVPPSTSYPGSPGFASVQQSHRKRLRRRRSSGRRKPHNQPKHDESGDLISLCCCFGDDDHNNQSHTGQQSSNSLTNRYLRYSCVIVMIIALATFASIMVSLQRKVDSLSWEVNKFSNAAGSHGFTSDQASPNQSLSVMQDLLAKHDQLNTSYSSLKTSFDELNQKVLNLEMQTKGLPPSVEEVRKDLATLGSELEGSIKEMQKDLQDFKIDNAKAKNDDNPKDGEGVPDSSGGESTAGTGTETGTTTSFRGES